MHGLTSITDLGGIKFGKIKSHIQDHTRKVKLFLLIGHHLPGCHYKPSFFIIIFI